MKNPWMGLAISGPLLILGMGASGARAQSVDLLVRAARVIDGTGAPWFMGDVAIADGRILAVGRNLDMEATQSIDAEGRILAPGFIDVHTHADRGIGDLPRADNFVLDGVTTAVGGNCGGSEAASRPRSATPRPATTGRARTRVKTGRARSA